MKSLIIRIKSRDATETEKGQSMLEMQEEGLLDIAPVMTLKKTDTSFALWMQA